jgi:AraC-like DNA-binding protein
MEVPRGATFADHAFGWGQLVHAGRGVARVMTADAAWVLPPGRALWVPGGLRHTVRCVTDLSVRALYFPPDEPPLPPRCAVVGVGPLLRAAILRIVELQLTGPQPERVGRLLAVVRDELADAVHEPLALPLPTDPAARRVAERILDDPSRALTRHTARSGASRRTIERRFADEVGVPLGHWRRAACLHAGLVALASGAAVSEAAGRAGYDSVSAFVAAFKRAFGETPAASVRHRDGGVAIE